MSILQFEVAADSGDISARAGPNCCIYCSLNWYILSEVPDRMLRGRLRLLRRPTLRHGGKSRGTSFCCSKHTMRFPLVVYDKSKSRRIRSRMAHLRDFGRKPPKMLQTMTVLMLEVLGKKPSRTGDHKQQPGLRALLPRMHCTK